MLKGVLLCCVIVSTLCRCDQSSHIDSASNPITPYGFSEDDVRISGGQYATEEQFPYMAVVHQLVYGMVARCGGSIISSRWVLTAAHCVANGGPKKFLLVFGIIDKSGIGYDSIVGPGVSMVSTQVIHHPRYIKGQTVLNDIALIHTPRNIPFSSSIQPIKLAGFSYQNFGMARVIGWGIDADGGNPTNELKYATIPTISNEECKQYWKINTDHVCTAGGFGEAACQGDSGGPLVISQNDEDIQIGIVSFGDRYCPSDIPAVFARVSSYTLWIANIVNTTYQSSEYEYAAAA